MKNLYKRKKYSVNISLSFLVFFFNCVTVFYTLSFSFENNYNNTDDCNFNDFQYFYTECDVNGKRWSVAVPKSHKAHCKKKPLLKSGVNCTFSCSAGSFFSIKSQNCEQCSGGTFSLGNGIRYEHLTEMPSGFSVENYLDDFKQIIIDSENKNLFEMKCSNQTGWVIQNGELLYLPTPCISKLSISLNFIVNGYIKIYYKMPTNNKNLFVNLQVRNALCQRNHQNMFFKSAQKFSSFSGNNFDNSNLLKNNEELENNNNLQFYYLKVYSGQNLITWTVANNQEKTTLADIIHVPKIDIYGLAFTPTCMPCLAGTFSKDGAEKCELCKAGTYSSKNSSSCQKCADDEYSNLKAKKCLKRPICTKFDYFKLKEQNCIENNTQQKYYIKKIQPDVCLEDLNEKKTNLSLKDSCSICRPGMMRNLQSGICEYCPENEFSENGLECKKCPENTIPDYGLFFTRWNVLPKEMSTFCKYVITDYEDCNFKPTWISLKNRLESARTRAQGIALGLNIKIATGFYNPLRTGGMQAKITLENPIAYFSIDFEVKCKTPMCQLYFAQEPLNNSAKTNFDLIASFNGTQERSLYNYPVLETKPTEFVLIFIRSGADLKEDLIEEHVIIYSINFTNVGNAESGKFYTGGKSCLFCSSKDPVTNKCKACEIGHYLDKNLKCVKCPFGTALNPSIKKKGIEQCEKCGPNLGSEDSTTCSFSGQFELNLTNIDDKIKKKTFKFNITGLKNQILTAKGIRVFVQEGNSYFHVYNVSIFGDPVRCYDSVYEEAIAIYNKTYDELNINNVLFCRSAVIFPTSSKFTNKNNTNNTKTLSQESLKHSFFISSTIISRHISAVTLNQSFHGFNLTNKQLEYDSLKSSSFRPIDVHIFYEPIITQLPNCPNGMIGVVTLRCDVTAAKKPLIRLSRNCPDGTCDGCLYHLIIESALACPICDQNDYQEIRGECINNQKKIHYIPSKYCILSGAKNQERIKICSNVSKNTFLLFFFAVILIILLLIIIFVFYDKNKKLEYRYIKIAKKNDSENLTSSSCALASDEEEDEIYKKKTYKNSKKTRVFFKKKNCNEYSKFQNLLDDKTKSDEIIIQNFNES